MTSANIPASNPHLFAPQTHRPWNRGPSDPPMPPPSVHPELSDQEGLCGFQLVAPSTTLGPTPRSEPTRVYWPITQRLHPPLTTRVPPPPTEVLSANLLPAITLRDPGPIGRAWRSHGPSPAAALARARRPPEPLRQPLPMGRLRPRTGGANPRPGEGGCGGCDPHGSVVKAAHNFFGPISTLTRLRFVASVFPVSGVVHPFTQRGSGADPRGPPTAYSRRPFASSSSSPFGSSFSWSAAL